MLFWDALGYVPASSTVGSLPICCKAVKVTKCSVMAAQMSNASLLMPDMQLMHAESNAQTDTCDHHMVGARLMAATQQALQQEPPNNRNRKLLLQKRGELDGVILLFCNIWIPAGFGGMSRTQGSGR